MYAYCANNPVMYSDITGYSPEWWQWALSGAQIALGVILCATGVGTVVGASLLVSGVSMLASNIMSTLGLDDKLSMQIQSGLNVVAGIALSFVPGMGGLGASMIGAGIVSFAGGYVSEALGGSYALGWGIGNIVGDIAEGMTYKGIINRLNTPSNMMNSFSNHPNRWKLMNEVTEAATGRAYRGGTSVYRYFQNIYTGSKLGTHTITVLEKIAHYHVFFW